MKLKLIIAGRGDGLGARFKNIIITKTLADYLKVPFLVSWCQTSTHCLCGMEHLISDGMNYVNVDSKIPNINDKELVTYVKDNYDIDLPNCNYLNPGKREIIVTEEIRNKYDVLLLWSNGFYRAEEPDYTDLHQKMIDSYNRIIMNEYIAEKIKEYTPLFTKYRIIAIHIRRGECVDKNETSKNSRRGNIPVEAVYHILDTKTFDNDKYLYFICSDDPIVIDTINKRYQRPITKPGHKEPSGRSKTFYYPCRSLDRTEPIAIQDAWITMNLLRMCYMIICSHSLFNKVPCFVGDVKRCVIRPNNMKKTMKMFKKLLKSK